MSGDPGLTQPTVSDPNYVDSNNVQNGSAALPPTTQQSFDEFGNAMIENMVSLPSQFLEC